MLQKPKRAFASTPTPTSCCDNVGFRRVSFRANDLGFYVKQSGLAPATHAHVPRSFNRGRMGLTDLRFHGLLGLSVTLLLTACAPGPRRQVVNPPGISPLVPAYSVAIRHGNMVFVSGMTAIKPGTQDIVDGGVAVQTRQTLENIQTVLQAAGAAMADVGECTVFLLDMADYAAMNRVYLEFFKADPPARATLAVSALPRPAARVEIKCSAVLGRRGGG
jgi:2-iminobutanoate/2-iminopropanoate deaminase